MTSKVISYSVILKRSNCLNSKAITESVSNSDVIFDRIKPSLNKPILNIAEKKMITSYFNALACIEEANSSYYKALDIIDEIQESSFRSQLITQFNERVLPYVQDLSYIKDTLDRYENITESEKDSVQKAAIGFNVSDRILKNHAYLSKVFNIENEVTKYSYKNLHDIVEKCGFMIDTYSMEPYKKLNLCIEEMCYLLEKNGCKYDKAQLVQYITEYFVLNTPDLSSRDLKNFKRVLNESYLIESSDLTNIEYLFKESNSEADSLTEAMEEFYRTPNKEDIRFDALQGFIIGKSSVLDIRVNIGRYIRFLWNVYSSGLYLEDNMKTNCTNIIKIINDKLAGGVVKDIDEPGYISKQVIIEIIDTVEKELSGLVIYNDTDATTAEKINAFKSIIEDNLIIPLKNITEYIYDKNNLVAMEAVNKIKLMGDETETAKKFKIFKFNNLIKASINLDKLLKAKEKALINKLVPKGKKILAKVNNVLFGESSDIYEFIGEDNRVDITVAQYYYNEEYISDIHEFFDTIVKECNTKLKIDGIDSAKCYYIMNPGIVEVHIKDATVLELTEEDKAMIAKANDASLDVYIESLALVDSVMEAYEELKDEQTISEMINDIDESFDFEHYELAMEAMKYLAVSKDDAELFTEKYSALKVVANGNNYNTITESKQVHSIYETWEAFEDVPIDVQLEAYQLLLAIMEDAKNVNKGKLSLANSTFNRTKDSTDYSGKSGGKFDLKKTKNDPDFDKQKKLSPEQEKELKKNPFKGININSIRLFLKGLGSKMGKMSQKERELSKQLDANFRRFVKSMKDALISDRREAIIKGSVIPSFSKCLKIATALAAVGKVAAIGTGAAFNPVAPLVIALGGFAMSKRLTKKERLLLLDDIEIELEVLDKEIANAESQNQMKKLRALMRYKKDLQRQYQRIRYNVRIGKDLLPNSSVGLKETD